MKNLFFVLIFLLLPVVGFAEESLQEKTQKILSNKTIDDPYTRFNLANNIISDEVDAFRLPFEEHIHLYKDILLPFVEKNIKDKRKYNIAKTIINLNLAFAHEIRGNPEDYPTIEAFYKKAVECADLSGDSIKRADSYDRYGLLLSTVGNVQLAHEYFYKAINIHESLNDYENITKCLYWIAENLLQIRDLAGLRKVIEQMQQYMEKPEFDGNPKCFYDLYSVQGAYYGILAEDYPENISYKDSALTAFKNTIQLIENSKNKITRTPAFVYYNTALLYSNRYPEQYDSIYYYLDKAIELRSGVGLVDIELDICVYELSAELHFAQKRYEQAEKDILYVLSLLEQIKDNNSVVIEYTETYKFLVMYYETMNRPREALKYYKLLLENEKKRYDNDKITAMDDMLVKYEAEKNKAQIDRLTEETKTAKRTLLLFITIIILLLSGLLILFWVYKLRKKNFELSIYETALQAELQHNELEQNRKEKEHLQEQYKKLETYANRNEQKARSYDVELKRIKQKMEQNPTKSMIGKLTDWISESNINTTKKETYIQQLSELNIDLLEQAYLTANEKISNMEMKYIICFAIDMDVRDMSCLFNVESASIRSVRYRIKKKFGEKNTFKFLM